MSTATGSLHTHNHGTFCAGEVELEVHECGHCGVLFAMALGFVKSRRNDHRSWFCPNGHSWHFSGASTEEKLKRQLERANDRAGRLASDLDQTTASLRAMKGVVTRQNKKLGRVANGVCPCCNRSFKNLERHMESKHPNFDGAKV